MKMIYHPERDTITLPGMLYALGDPVRLSIVKRLAAEGELTCGVAYPHPIPKSTLSHHLKILREAGLIHVRQQGREYYNSLRREDIDARFPNVLTAVIAAAPSEAHPDREERGTATHAREHNNREAATTHAEKR